MKIQVDYQERVAVVKLDGGVPNPIGREMVSELAEIIEGAKRDSGVIGLVLGSANQKIFSLGFDLPGLYDLSRYEFRHFYHSFNQTCLELYTFPKPTVAAIGGHAIAGGCILALCCDYRYIAEGRTLMGLNEVKLGVPVPYLPDCILRQVAGDRCAREIMDTGDFFSPEVVLEMGLVDQVLPPEQVLPGGIEKAAELGSLPRGAFRMIKQNRVEVVLERYERNREDRERYFIDHWYSEGTRELLKKAMEKF